LQLRGAFAVALLFALHPVQVESVAWISELKNVLSTQFYLLALNQYLSYTLPNQLSKNQNNNNSYILSLIFYIFALLSKTVTCTFPLTIMILTWWQTGRIQLKNILDLIPFFGLGIGFALGTAWMERNVVGASGEWWSFTFLERCLIAGRAFWFYPAKLIWPAHLSFMYPRWDINTLDIRGWIFPITAIGVIFILWMLHRRIGKGPLACVLFYTVTIFPCLGFVNIETMIYTFVADHYQYLAGVGLLVLGVAGIHKIFCYAVPVRKMHIVIFITSTFMFGFLTWRQATLYQNNLILFNDVLKKNPYCWEGFLVRGTAYAKMKNYSLAIEDFSQALSLRPDYAKAYSNRGTIYSYEGQYAKAIKDFDQAIQLKPDYAKAYNNRGFVYYMKKDFSAAIRDFNRAIELDPHDSQAYFNRGQVRKMMGDPIGAGSDFRKVQKIKSLE
jgi:tetratricopeptide (TPR) repeat protein